jgi:hypothetical protein
MSTLLSEGATVMVSKVTVQSKNLVVVAGQQFPPPWQHNRDLLAGLAEHLGHPKRWSHVARVAVVKQGALVDAVTGEPITVEVPEPAKRPRWRDAR